MIEQMLSKCRIAVASQLFTELSSARVLAMSGGQEACTENAKPLWASTTSNTRISSVAYKDGAACGAHVLDGDLSAMWDSSGGNGSYRKKYYSLNIGFA